jgi:hypothetical protein
MSDARGSWHPIRSRFLRPTESRLAIVLYSAALSVILTALTAFVGWGVVTRLRDLYGAVPKRLEELRWLERVTSLADRGALVAAGEQYREHCDVEAQIAALESNRHESLAKWVSTSTGFEQAMKKPITVTDGAPPRFVVGDAPTYPWLPDKVAWCLDGDYRKKLNAWYAAKLMCDQLNAGEKAFGTQIAELREKHRRTGAALAACRTKLEDHLREAVKRADSQMPHTNEETGEVHSAVDAAIRWADLNARDAWATGAKVAFLFLDLPTLLTCLAITAAAWSRFLLAGDWLGQTRITG